MVLALVLAAAPSLTTIAEASGYRRTGRYAEVEALCDAFPKAFPGKVRCDTFGTTPQGRAMRVLVASADGTLSPEACEAKGRPVVALQGGIHAGEIDGKDAGFALLRDVLQGKVLAGALAKVTLLFIPVLNVDGHERFGPNQRPNQVGPEETGWRVTATNLNLNRDFIKAEAPELQAVLGLLQRYRPVLYADLHVTDGAKFQHDVSVTFEPRHAGPATVRSLGRAWGVALAAELTEKGHLPVDFYPSFVVDDDPTSGFAHGVAPPRFSHAYWAQHNRFGVLVETHSWRPYAHRVKTTYDVCAGLVRLAADDGARWRKAALEADAADEKRVGGEVTLLSDATQFSKPLDFLGYAYTAEPSAISGKKWLQYDDTKPQVWTVPLYDEVVPRVTAALPAGGYLVPVEHAGWVGAKLKLHGVRFTVLSQNVKAAAVESMTVEPVFRPQPYEGRHTVSARGTWRPEVVDVAKGSLFVPSSQPHQSLVAHLFEPASPDSLLSWGYFNAHLEQKEYLEDYLAEAYARELLADAGVRAAFEATLKDETFAKSADARLRFFSSRHPSADSRLNRYPVQRTAQRQWR